MTLVRNTPLVIMFAFFSFAAPTLDIKFNWLDVHIGDYDFTALFGAAVASLTLYTSSFVCEALRAGINAVPLGQAEAARAIGLPFGGVMSQVVLPQAFRAAMPPLASVQIALIKNTSVAAVFGVAEATAQMRGFTNDYSAQRLGIFVMLRDRLHRDRRGRVLPLEPSRAALEGGHMTTSVLFDAPGPRTVRRHRLYGVLAVLGLLAVLAFAIDRFYDAGQFEGDKWEVFVTPDYVRVILVDGLLNTLKMAAVAILGATVLGSILGVGKLSDHGFIRWPAWLVVEFFRAVPVLLLMVFTWYLIGINRDGSSFWAVVIALTLYNGAVLAEVLRAGVNAVPKGQREAAFAIGMRKTQVMNIVLLPQAVKIMLPAIISQCIVALKDTALGQYVLAPGLTKIYKQIYLEFTTGCRR